MKMEKLDKMGGQKELQGKIKLGGRYRTGDFTQNQKKEEPLPQETERESQQRDEKNENGRNKKT